MSQTIKLSKLKEIIRDLLTKELEEASTTVTAGGSYMTPAAFTAKGKDRRKKNAKQSGYALAEAKFAVKFQLGSEMGDTATIIVNAGSAGAAKMVVAKQLKGGAKKVVSVKRVDAGKAKQIDKKLESVNEAAKGLKGYQKYVAKNKGKLLFYAESPDSEVFMGLGKTKNGKFDLSYGIMGTVGPTGNTTSAPDGDVYSSLSQAKRGVKDQIRLAKQGYAHPDEKKFSWKVFVDKLNESINEGKYHEYRNDKTRTSKQKIGRSMMEVRDKLNELDKLVKMNIKLKNELGVDSTSYWKRTHSAMKKISERLVKLANKVGQLH